MRGLPAPSPSARQARRRCRRRCAAARPGIRRRSPSAYCVCTSMRTITSPRAAAAHGSGRWRRSGRVVDHAKPRRPLPAPQVVRACRRRCGRRRRSAPAPGRRQLLGRTASQKASMCARSLRQGAMTLTQVPSATRPPRRHRDAPCGCGRRQPQRSYSADMRVHLRGATPAARPARGCVRPWRRARASSCRAPAAPRPARRGGVVAAGTRHPRPHRHPLPVGRQVAGHHRQPAGHALQQRHRRGIAARHAAPTLAQRCSMASISASPTRPRKLHAVAAGRACAPGRAARPRAGRRPAGAAAPGLRALRAQQRPARQRGCRCGSWAPRRAGWRCRSRAPSRARPESARCRHPRGSHRAGARAVGVDASSRSCESPVTRSARRSVQPVSQRRSALARAASPAGRSPRRSSPPGGGRSPPPTGRRK